MIGLALFYIRPTVQVSEVRSCFSWINPLQRVQENLTVNI